VDTVANYLNLENKVEIKSNYYKDLDELKNLGHGTLAFGISLASEDHTTQDSTKKETSGKVNANVKNLLCTQAQVLQVDITIRQADIVYHLFGLFKVEKNKNISRKQLKTKGINNSKELMGKKLTLLALSENPLQ